MPAPREITSGDDNVIAFFPPPGAAEVEAAAGETHSARHSEVDEAYSVITDARDSARAAVDAIAAAQTIARRLAALRALRGLTEDADHELLVEAMLAGLAALIRREAE